MDMDHNHTAKATCPMIMVFHGGHCERILWRGWVASTYVEFTFSCIALFLMAFFYEALKFMRQQLLRRSARKASERMALEVQNKGTTQGGCCGHTPKEPLPEIRERTFKEHLLSADHIIQTLLNMVQIILGYLLMLVFMNFNYWLCLSMTLGLGFGYFLFGWIVHPMSNECCN